MDLTFQFTAASYQGARTTNQDNLAVYPSLRCFQPQETEAGAEGKLNEPMFFAAVCDGVGGSKRGDLAAHAALEAMQTQWDAAEDRAEQPLEAVANALAQAANKAVLALPGSSATTLTLAVIRGADYCLLNIGDSPAFFFPAEKNGAAELTRRHNMAQFRLEWGKPPVSGAAQILLSCLGSNPILFQDHCTGTLKAGDALLLCSDGITNTWTMEELHQAIRDGASARMLAEKAQTAPEADNCTAVVLLAAEAQNA